jgi:hypothetical protein
MRIQEIQGLTAAQKEVLVTDFDAAPPADGAPFEDDTPTHTITFEALGERHAAVSSVLAYDHLHPTTHLGETLIHKAGVALTELQMVSLRGEVILTPERSEDKAVVNGMLWAANNEERVGSLTLARIAEDAIYPGAAKLVDFIGGEEKFTLSLVVLRDCVEIMDAAGVLEEIDPDHVHTLPSREHRPERFMAPGPRGFHA